jgi:hypothetical protein
MVLEFMNGVVEAHNQYHEWAQGGRDDEQLGSALLDQLRRLLAPFVRLDGELASLKIAKGGSGLELTVLRACQD